jgi:hypothetical protein
VKSSSLEASCIAVRKHKVARMSFLEIMFLIIMGMLATGLISQALVDLTGMGRFKKDNEIEERKDKE